MRGTFTGANASFHILLWRNKQTCDRFKMNGKAKACNSRAVATSGWLELSYWRPNSRGGCGFQDYAFGIGLGPRVVVKRALPGAFSVDANVWHDCRAGSVYRRFARWPTPLLGS
jgi:hypothetical protein